MPIYPYEVEFDRPVDAKLAAQFKYPPRRNCAGLAVARTHSTHAASDPRHATKMVQAEYRLFVRTAPEAEIKKRKGLKTFTAEDGIEVPHEALKEAKVADHSEAYYPYQKDISLRLADAKDPEGSLTGRVMLKADPADDVCEYADDFEVAPLPEANEALNEIGLPTIPTKYTLVKVRI